VLTFAARCAVAALRPQVVFAVLPGAAAIPVRIAPRVLGHIFLEVGPVPVGHVGVALERVQPLGAIRILPDVQPIAVEAGAEQLDLGSRRCLLGLADAAEETRPHQADEQAEDDDDHEQLDQREPRFVTEADRVSRGRDSHRLSKQPPRTVAAGHGRVVRPGARALLNHGPGARALFSHPGAHAHYKGISLIEKIAISIATTMKATSTPMSRMIAGSSRPIRRLSSVRTSVSNVSAVLRSISSRRPVSSPTRTMCTASGGKFACSASPLASVPPRLTVSPSRSTARPTTWFDIMSPTTASAPSTGTPLFSIVPSVRANRTLLGMPHVGSLVMKIEAARFARTLGTMLKSGEDDDRAHP